MIKLNLGCQLHYFEGWINIDIVGDDKDFKLDLVCDVSKLPYEDNSVDLIYAGHLVEHFYPDTLEAVLREWRRVLRVGGKLIIVTPDCGSVFKDYASGKLTVEHTWQQIYGRINHYDSAPERHHIAFDDICLQDFLYRAGNWAKCRMIDMERLANWPDEIVPFHHEHISAASYQLGIELVK